MRPLVIEMNQQSGKMEVGTYFGLLINPHKNK